MENTKQVEQKTKAIFAKPFPLRMPVEMTDEIDVLAIAEGRTRSNMIRVLLAEALNHRTQQGERWAISAKVALRTRPASKEPIPLRPSPQDEDIPGRPALPVVEGPPRL